MAAGVNVIKLIFPFVDDGVAKNLGQYHKTYYGRNLVFVTGVSNLVWCLGTNTLAHYGNRKLRA